MEKIKVISIVIKHRYDVIDAGYCGLDMIVMAVLGVILFFLVVIGAVLINWMMGCNIVQKYIM